jgi:hypothetical protein
MHLRPQKAWPGDKGVAVIMSNSMSDHVTQLPHMDMSYPGGSPYGHVLP